MEPTGRLRLDRGSRLNHHLLEAYLFVPLDLLPNCKSIEYALLILERQQNCQSVFFSEGASVLVVCAIRWLDS